MISLIRLGFVCSSFQGRVTGSYDFGNLQCVNTFTDRCYEMKGWFWPLRCLPTLTVTHGGQIHTPWDPLLIARFCVYTIVKNSKILFLPLPIPTHTHNFLQTFVHVHLEMVLVINQLNPQILVL